MSITSLGDPVVPATSRDATKPVVRLAIGIIAWNEEECIRATLDSLFHQTLFAECVRRNWQCEIRVLGNGCTDRTVQFASESFEHYQRLHPASNGFHAMAIEVPIKGKLPTWNLFVHELSARTADYLFLMDADILLNEASTLWSMVQALEKHPEAYASVDEPIKDIASRAPHNWKERLSLAMSRKTRDETAQLTGQLYCVRSEIARKIYLPRDLTACDDGFIKWLLCTNFLTEPTNLSRIIRAQGASHVFEAYTGVGSVLNNQKRQMIGQTMVHLLIDQKLPTIPMGQRKDLGQLLQQWDQEDPTWLREHLAQHLRRTRYFWRLFPGIPLNRFKKMRMAKGFSKFKQLPAALAGFVVMMIACWLARRFLKKGNVEFWPDTRSTRLGQVNRPVMGSGQSRHTGAMAIKSNSKSMANTPV